MQKRLALLYSLLAVLIPGAAFCSEQGASLLAGYNLETLLNLEVSTATKRLQPMSRTPAAAHVISREEIIRSGATSIPEALRLAPGVEVAQITPNQWSVSIRGFGGLFANKLLVLIDGRSIYTPTFNGVYWSHLDIPMDNLERIEVIRGPGTSLWGENAVNGVINIITRSATDTIGSYFDVHAGDNRRSAALRWGSPLNNAMDLQIWLNASDTESFEPYRGSFYYTPSEISGNYRYNSAGFRMDWHDHDLNQWMLQGSLFDLETPPSSAFFNDEMATAATASGNHFLARWERSISADSEIALQLFTDYYDLKSAEVPDKRRFTDLDFQHSFHANKRHRIIWGGGYRQYRDQLRVTRVFQSISPARGKLRYANLFAQNEMTLLPERLWLLMGAKIEKNDLTGYEWQPQLRALWQPSHDLSVWTSLALSSRLPSRVERQAELLLGRVGPDLELNISRMEVNFRFIGNKDFDAERVNAWEFGFRKQLSHQLSFDTALYYNEYEKLRDGELLPIHFDNNVLFADFGMSNTINGAVYGGEFYADWQPLPAWRFQLGLNVIEFDIDSAAKGVLQSNPLNDFLDSTKLHTAYSAPWQLSLRAGWSPSPKLDLDMWLRAAGEKAGNFLLGAELAGTIAAYQTLDVKIAWRPAQSLELAFSGKNLLDEQRLEFIGEFWTTPWQVPRSVALLLRYDF